MSLRDAGNFVIEKLRQHITGGLSEEEQANELRVHRATESVNELISKSFNDLQSQILELQQDIKYYEATTSKTQTQEVRNLHFTRPVFCPSSTVTPQELKKLKVSSCIQLLDTELAMKSYVIQLQQIRAQYAHECHIANAAKIAKFTLEAQRKDEPEVDFSKREILVKNQNTLESQLEILPNGNARFQQWQSIITHYDNRKNYKARDFGFKIRDNNDLLQSNNADPEYTPELQSLFRVILVAVNQNQKQASMILNSILRVYNVEDLCSDKKEKLFLLLSNDDDTSTTLFLQYFLIGGYDFLTRASRTTYLETLQDIMTASVRAFNQCHYLVNRSLSFLNAVEISVAKGVCKDWHHTVTKCKMVVLSVRTFPFASHKVWMAFTRRYKSSNSNVNLKAINNYKQYAATSESVVTKSDVIYKRICKNSVLKHYGLEVVVVSRIVFTLLFLHPVLIVESSFITLVCRVLVLCNSEEKEAFEVLENLLVKYRMAGLFDKSSEKARHLAFGLFEMQLSSLLPELKSRIVNDLRINLYEVTRSWFKTLFTYHVKVSDKVLRHLFDCFLFSGWKFIYQIIFYTLDVNYDEIMAKNRDESIEFLKDLPVNFSSAAFRNCKAMTIKNKQLWILEEVYDATGTLENKMATTVSSEASWEV